jgi:hypothetical protein
VGLYSVKEVSPGVVEVALPDGQPMMRLEGGTTPTILITYLNYVSQNRHDEADMFIYGVFQGILYWTTGGVTGFSKPTRGGEPPSTN